MTLLIEIIRTMRPQQWTKNGIVFGALIFSKSLFDLPKLFAVGGTFVLFCLISGSVYLLNDIADREKDAQHPKKRFRPIPAGHLSIRVALISLVVIATVSHLSAFWLSPLLFVTALLYFSLNVAYSFFLKHVVIIDVLIIAVGFVIRAIAGAVVISAEISAWLIVCTFLLALFLALAKRRNELQAFEVNANDYRRVLSEYSLELLDHMIAVVAAVTVMAYSLYTFDDRTVQIFGTNHLSVTIPFVVYGIFRYLYLIHKKGLGGSPEIILLTDKGILINLAAWLMTSVLIIYLKW